MNTAEFNAPSRNLPPVIINDVTLTPVEVDGIRLITLAMVDRVHGRPEGTARKRFNDNRGRLAEGKHFLKMRASVFRTRFPGQLAARATEDVTLVTERGYLMLVKSLTDDVAWDVQETLVESYFSKPKPLALPTRGPRMDVSREHRLMFKDQVAYAKMAGLKGNQALLAANRATKALTGIDNIGLLGVESLPAPRNEALLSPSDVAQRLGMKSSQAVNKRLCELWLQSQHRDHKGRVYYEPTEAGTAGGAVMVDTGKKHGDGAPVRQLRWSSSILRYLEESNGQRH